jgi:hypothetical protein
MEVKLKNRLNRSIAALLGVMLITGCEQKIEDTTMLVDIELNLPKGAQEKIKQKCKISEPCRVTCLGPSPDDNNKQVKYLVSVRFYEHPFPLIQKSQEKKDKYMASVAVYLEGFDEYSLYQEAKKIQWEEKMTVEGSLEYKIGNTWKKTDIGTIKATISKS